MFHQFANPSVARTYFLALMDTLRQTKDIVEHSCCHVYSVIDSMNVSEEKKMICKMAYDEILLELERKRRLDREREIQMMLELTLYSV